MTGDLDVADGRIGEAELEELRAATRDFLTAKADEAAVRAAAASDRGYDEKVWAQMAEQLGLQALALPAEHGGDGAGMTALSVVLGELGRVLLPAPFFSSVVLAGTALAAAGDADAARRLLPGIAAGTTLAALAAPGRDGGWDLDGADARGGLAVAAEPGQCGVTLDGSAPLVVDGAGADVVLVVAAGPAGPTLCAVDGTAVGLTRTSLPTLDLTRRVARLDFWSTPATVVGEPGGAAGVLRRVLDVATAALAAEQVGGARACLDAATAYAKDRVQFGRPIGTFQAVKHKCADMFTRIQVADAAAREAAAALDGAAGAPDPGVAAAVAHVVCSEAFMAVAAENIQVHGGIGFTWEHPAHLYFRRAKSSQLLFGGPAVYHERLLARAGM
ncbi:MULTISPECIES: acyl-CoA dehydrogenase family protein [unclassified Pseudofrankia]|uniref:acyl-CoA dehydrogenase family protein n=1 Tax=unclassified Pseudofrankia TaxID=2994372 RepID=UPI0008DB0F1C|nr:MULTISPECIES: acyl-CoA dehydrogenase family protein [unclassified Pseudofrankia]MDT3441979.1 acyl-CoA dehydrogenase family protein [Pseudofrankia sp. BMG5.37]OHV44604.1 acyl-CoA dehydrogenase [Pseudofrankia sp. BMG5.36]